MKRLRTFVATRLGGLSERGPVMVRNPRRGSFNSGYPNLGRCPNLAAASALRADKIESRARPCIEIRTVPNLVVLVALLVLACPGTGWAQFTYSTNNGAIILTGYTGSGGNVDIPDTINGYPVTTIADDSFVDQTNLTEATIPDSVTSIGDDAFEDCSGLTNVTIGNRVTNMGDYAFSGCSILASATIPNSVVSIGRWTFSDCYNLKSATIGNSVTTMGDGVFAGCFRLKSVTIPNGVTSISEQAFWFCSGLADVTIPDSVTNIGYGAFYYCSGLTSLMMPNSITSIGTFAFSGCSSLNTVTIPGNVTDIEAYAFSSCTGLRQVYFQGNAPSVDGGTGSADGTVFQGESGTVYYVPGTTDWGAAFGGWPTAEWFQPHPEILGSDYGLGVGTQGFQFTISWATNAAVVVEASTNLQDWIPVSTNTLVSGTNLFLDSDWARYPQRFYRVRSQ
jgi:BspA type Leucine rich repeat region (6 copies)